MEKEIIILFTGIIGLLTALARIIFSLSKKKDESKQSLSTATNNVSITNTFSPNVPTPSDIISQNKKIKFKNLEEAKSKAKILFIDDDRQYAHAKILKRNGWENTSIILDLNSIDADQARFSDIFFVDIHGVGKKMSFQDEGLGLSRALMDKYPEKYIVIYSSENNGDRFHEMIRKADYTLNKFADIYEFEKCLSKLLVQNHE